MTIRRMILGAVGASSVLALGLAAQPAVAEGPPIVTHSGKTSGSVVLTDTCQGFDVRLDFTAGNATFIEFPDGTGFTAGSFRGTLTRVEADGSDGASVAFNFSGPGRFALDGPVVYARGPWLLVGTDDPATPEWEGQAVLARGRTVFEPGNSVVLSTTAPVRDLCAELA